MTDSIRDHLLARAETASTEDAALLREAAAEIKTLAEQRGRFGKFEGDTLRINVNDQVLYPLTEWSLNVLREGHNADFLKWGVADKYGFQRPKTDEHGRAQTQLWEYARVFGPHMQMGMHPGQGPATQLWLKEAPHAAMLREMEHTGTES